MQKFVWLIPAILIPAATAATPDQSIYTDALQNAWESWGWAGGLDYNSTARIHGGTKSIAVTPGAWEAIYLHHAAFDSSDYTGISFWIHGGTTAGQKLQLQALLSGTAQTAVQVRPTNGWQEVTVPLANLGAANKPDLDGFWIQDNTGAPQPTFYLDDIRLIASTTPPTPPTPVTLTVDTSANRRDIDPRVYGMCFATEAQVADLNVPLNRSGGNSESRYNWQINAHNRGADWYFQSLADSSATPGAETDAFIAGTKNSGAQPMITIPILDWTTKLGPGRQRLSSFSIAKYGSQTDRDWQWFPDAGNGIKTNSPLVYVTGNDPNDANQPVTSAFQMDWVRYLTSRWGLSANSGIKYYILDNEHSLWHSTHRDVKPIGATMREIRDKYIDYATKIKDLDPNALIVGPEEWGWSGYFYSGADQQTGASNGWSRFPDRELNGNRDFMPWLLEQMRTNSQAAGRRLLDIFTLHYYPQSGEYSANVGSSTQLSRNRSTRSLWDTNYTDASWIGDKVRLIPRMRDWVNAHYPGTQIGITEYSWGADNHINGATAQADIFGLFGREGIDLATRWTTPDTGSPTYNAIKMYRNYDGQKSTFGQTSVKATAPDADKVAVFAAERNDGALTVIAVNKQLTADAPVFLTLTNFAASTAQRWQLTSANAITRLADQTITNNSISNTLPAQSITLHVLTNSAPRLSLVAIRSNDLDLRVTGIRSNIYVVQASSNLTSWIPVKTNTASTASFDVTVSAPDLGAKNWFFRVIDSSL